MSLSASWVWGPCLFLFLCALPSPGRAQATADAQGDPPVAAVIPFGAVPAAQAQVPRINAACEGALRRIAGLKVVTAAQWEKEAKESGAGDDLEAMARRLGADAMVTGSLSRAAAGWRLSIDVFDEKGMPAQSGALDLPVPELGPAAIFRMEDLIEKLVRPVVELPAEAAAPPSGPEPSPQDVDTEKPAELAPAVEIPQRAQPEPRYVRPPWRPVFEGDAGPMVMARTLGCGAPLPARRNQPCTQTLFPIDAGIGLRVHALFFPGALFRAAPRAAAGLGLELLLEAPFWRDRTESGPGGTISGLKVTELRFEVGARLRHSFGESARRPVLEAGLVYGFHEFNIASSTLPFPNVQYQYLMPSIGLGSYLTPSFYLHGGAGLVGAFTAGDATAAVNEGNQNPFGPGTVIGFRAGLEAHYNAYRGLTVSAGAYAEQMSFFLAGEGCTMTATTQQKCDASLLKTMTPDAVTTATDLYIAGFVSLGYRY